MELMKVLVLFGGCSSEHEVSLESAAAVLSHLDTSRFAPVAAGITRQGQWLLYEGEWDALAAGGWESRGVPCTLNLARGSRELLLLDGSSRRVAVDVAFPVLHGKNGEDGTVQGACELAGLPVVGCGTLAGALCMDKVRAHRLAAAAGVRVPQNRCFGRCVTEEELRAAAEELRFPLFVKPLRAGSSLGVSRVERMEALQEAVQNALQYDSEVVVEQAVDGFEVGCAVMGNDVLTVGLVDEIELSGGFFDFTEKYTLKTSRVHCPARISLEKAAEVRRAAKTVYRALGCRGMARVDLFLTPDHEIVFNEVNTIPGFTAHSRFPSMMQGIGLGFRELLTRLIELGVQG